MTVSRSRRWPSAKLVRDAMKTDGLSSLHYVLAETRLEPLFTHIRVWIAI